MGLVRVLAGAQAGSYLAVIVIHGMPVALVVALSERSR
jgi:hypothetical protein